MRVVAVPVMAGVTGMITVHVVTNVSRAVIVVATVFTASVPNLNLANQVVLLVTLALVRWAVALATRVVVASTHQPGVALVRGAGLLVRMRVRFVVHVLVLFVVHLGPVLVRSALPRNLGETALRY